MKTSKVLFNLSAVFCFLYGALYIFSLVFIPIGIYCFLASKRFAYKADHLFESYSLPDKVLKNYVIFASIACFPLGLLSIIPYYLVVSNKIKVSGFTVKNNENDNQISETNVTVGDIKDANSQASETNSNAETVSEQSAPIEETYEEKLEKFKKLENFKEKGIITEEELEMAREQLFGKNKD